MDLAYRVDTASGSKLDTVAEVLGLHRDYLESDASLRKWCRAKLRARKAIAETQEAVPPFKFKEFNDQVQRCEHMFCTSNSKGDQCTGCRIELLRCRYKGCSRHAWAPWAIELHAFDLSYCQEHSLAKRKLEAGPGIKGAKKIVTCDVGADWED